MTEPVLNSSSAALKSYGGIGEQNALPGTNVIATKLSGGKNKRKSAKKGGQGLTEIAVPALLITANHLYGRKTASKKLGKKRFSRRRGRSFRRRR